MADHSVKTRYQSAQTVSDEHGKGAEVLRQAVGQFYQTSSPVASETITVHVLDCEVDVWIRWIRVMCVDIPDANADLTIYRNRAGTLTALASAVALDGLTTEVFSNVTVTVADNSLRKDDSVYGLCVRDSTSSESGDVGVYMGWQPDIFGDNDYRTF
jgi:hypothetical protein